MSENILQPGDTAPPFTLETTPGKEISLTDYSDKPVILAFYPADWSPVCGDQMALYNEMLETFESYNAQLIGISVDGPWCHQAYSQAKHLEFPLLSDFEPKGEVSRSFGAYNTKDGKSKRALFVVKPGGQIHWSYLSPVDQNPGADGILNALEQL